MRGASPHQGLHHSAQDSFRMSNDLEMIVQRYYHRRGERPAAAGLHRGNSVGLSVMTPVKPMLAEAVKTVEVCTADRGPARWAVRDDGRGGLLDVVCVCGGIVCVWMCLWHVCESPAPRL